MTGSAAIGNPFIKTTCGEMDSGLAFQAPRNDGVKRGF